MSLLAQSGYPFALVVAVLLLLALFWLLRTQRLREKYSVLWFAVIVGVVLLTFVPAITGWITGFVGVTTPINLVFILAFLVLLVVCIQLSIEISTLEESARTVAEEVALLRLELERRTGGPGTRATDDDTDDTDDTDHADHESEHESEHETSHGPDPRSE